MNKLLLLTALFTSLLLSAQEVDTMDYYRLEPNHFIEKFEREHLPLDGRLVNMIPCRVDDKYGFVEKGNPGKWIIQPQFSQVFAVYPSAAIVSIKDDYGVVNSSGQMIAPAVYENLFKEGDLYHGLVQITDDILPADNLDSYSYERVIRNDYYTEKGEPLFTENAHDFQSFGDTDTLAWFRYGRTYHIRGISGKLWQTFTVSDEKKLSSICNNLLLFHALKNEDIVHEAYDVYGNLIFSLPYEGWGDYVFKLSDDLFGFMTNEGSGYFCNAKGEEMPYKKPYTMMSDFARYAQTEYFKTKLITVQDSTENLAVIDHNGKNLTGFIYRYIAPFYEGKAFCMDLNGNLVTIDETGKVLSDFSKVLFRQNIEKISTYLNSPLKFSDGMGVGNEYTIIKVVTKEGKVENHIDEDSTYFFYFDDKGKTVLQLPGNYIIAGYFREGLAPVVNKDRGLGFIDITGKMMIQPKYEVAVAGAYPIPYVVIPEFIGGYAYIKSFKGYIDREGNEYFSGKRMQDHYNFSH